MPSNTVKATEIARSRNAAGRHARALQRPSSTTKGRSVGATPGYLALAKRFALVPLRDDKHLKQAHEMIEELLSRRLSRQEGSYLDVLTDLVADYEDRRYSFPRLAPTELVRHLLESNELTQAELARGTGLSRPIVSQLLSGSRKMTLHHVKALSAFFHVSPSVLLG
jgi:antitoxin component HigA of HigAB toxin-antitoxin module